MDFIKLRTMSVFTSANFVMTR